MFTTEIKKQCVILAEKNDPKIIANQLKVPLKSLKRWLSVGAERKKGGGRKIKDPEMEKKLYDWYTEFHDKNNYPVTAKLIKKKALEFKTCRDFIASKGWLEKFKKKFRLDITRECNLVKKVKK